MLSFCELLYFCVKNDTDLDREINRIEMKLLASSTTEFVEQPSLQHSISPIECAHATVTQPPAVTFKTRKSEMPALFKLNIDCISNILDYLSLVDLANVAQTCKLLHTVAGHILQLHYPFANAFIDESGMYLENHDEMKQFIDIFSEFIQCATFSDVMNDDSTQIQWQQFKSIKHISFYYIRFNEKNLNLTKVILPNVETVELNDCYFCGYDLYGNFLKHCTNLKKLIIWTNYNYNANWLHYKYPHLEYVSIVPIVYIRREINQLAIFFQQNPNVRKFFTSAKFLLDNKTFIMQAKFEELKILVDELEFQPVYALINELHAKCVYKRIHITFFECFKIDQSFIDQLNTIKSLVGLRVPAKIIELDLNSLVNLEILRFDCNINRINNITQLPQNLTNLREISFVQADIDDILLFVYQLPRLRKISVEKLTGFRRDIDLHAVNRERKELFEIAIHVSKVLIYIPEIAYLRIRNQFTTMNLDLIEILRYELYDNTRF